MAAAERQKIRECTPCGIERRQTACHVIVILEYMCALRASLSQMIAAKMCSSQNVSNRHEKNILHTAMMRIKSYCFSTASESSRKIERMSRDNDDLYVNA